jgi:MoxR-like ATPase
VVLATQNPIEMEGTFPLPEAQLDRFLFKVKMGYPDAAALKRIAESATSGSESPPDRRLGPERVVAMQRLATEVPIADELSDLVVRIIRATHPDDPGASDRIRRFVRFGTSPRALQAIVRGAKVHALGSGRFHVAPADLAAVVFPSLRHRIGLNFDAALSGVDADDLTQDIVTKELG